MSANVNVTNPERRKKVLLIAANPATSPTTGWPIGFWWAELTHPYWAFVEAGYELRKVQPFDLFPQTKHLECVMTLERRAS